MSNTDLWDKVSKTNPKHTSEFKRPGGFKGTAIKPLYVVQKATEIWGPMGGLWGAEHVDHVIQGDSVFVRARVWYPGATGRATVEHWGGDVLTKKSGEAIIPNDEAFKMAFTDAVGKCLSMLGFCADVHLGMFSDSKYVREMDEQHGNVEPPIFKNATLRKTFVQNVLDSITACQSLDELDTVSGLNREMVMKMKKSQNDHDVMGADEIIKQKEAKVAELQGKALDHEFKERV